MKKVITLQNQHFLKKNYTYNFFRSSVRFNAFFLKNSFFLFKFYNTFIINFVYPYNINEMTSYCSPSHEEIYDKTKTCYTKDQLVFIAKKYNNTRKDKRSHIKLNTLKKELLHKLHNKLKVNEHEWNDLSFMKQIQN